MEQEKNAAVTHEQRLEVIVAHSSTGLVVLDTADCIVFANAAAGELLATPREALIGTVLTTSCVPGHGAVLEYVDQQGLELTSSSIEWDGGPARLIVINAPTRRSPEAAAPTHRNAAVNRLGFMALQGVTPAELHDAAAIFVRDELGVNFSTVLQYDADSATASLVAGTGWPTGLVGSYVMPVDGTSQASTALLTGKPIAVLDWREETRFPGVDVLHDHHIISGVSVVIPGENGSLTQPWGVLGAHATWRREFTAHDIDFVQGLANVLAQALQQTKTLTLKNDSDMLLRAAGRTARLGGWEVDLEADRVIWSEEVAVINGLPAERLVQTTAEAAQYTAPESRGRATQAIQACLRDGVHFDIELQIITREKQRRWVRAIGEPVTDDSGRIVRVRGAIQDITAQKNAEIEADFLTLYDPVTRLPNRRLLEDRLRQAIAGSQRNGSKGAVMLLDLDDFKAVNDTLGHHVGDQLLQQVARRLCDALRETDTVARFGGDEFVVIVNNLDLTRGEAGAEAESIGHKLLARLDQPYQLGAHKRFSTQSIGITLFGVDDSEQPEDLLSQADMAMYSAKARGRDQLCMFDPDMATVVRKRAALETDMRQGLKQGEFYACYQSQVDANDRIIGAEILARWQHPQRGVVSPGEFIPVAEQTGLVQELGRFMLETACRQLVRWSRNPATAALTLSVNVSAEQFHHPDFVPGVSAIIAETAADPHRLVLELTESAVVKNMEDTAEKMTVLKALGVTFSLDDFGTGYSSLYCLKHLPLAELKIDQSFVRRIYAESDNAAIARMIIGLADAMELRVVAEGVESIEERKLLAELGCRCYQGFLFTRPQPIENFEAYLRRRQSAQLHF